MTLRDRIRAAVQDGNHREALRLAATIPDADLLGWGPDIKRGREAQLRPRFQEQLGRDPLAIIQIGATAVEAFLRGEHKCH